MSLEAQCPLPYRFFQQPNLLFSQQQSPVALTLWTLEFNVKSFRAKGFENFILDECDARLLSRTFRASTFHDMPQMESLLAG